MTYRLTQHVQADAAGNLPTPLERDIAGLADLLGIAHWPGTWARGDKFWRWSISHRGRADQFTLLAEIDKGCRWFIVGMFSVDPVELDLPEWEPPKFPARGPATRQELRRQRLAPATTYLQLDGANQRGHYLRVRNSGRQQVKLKHGDVLAFRGLPKKFVVVMDFALQPGCKGELQVSPPLGAFTANGAMVDFEKELKATA